MKLIAYSTQFPTLAGARYWAGRMSDLAKRHDFDMYIETRFHVFYVWRTICDSDLPLTMYLREENYPNPDCSLLAWVQSDSKTHLERSFFDWDLDKLLAVSV